MIDEYKQSNNYNKNNSYYFFFEVIISKIYISFMKNFFYRFVSIREDFINDNNEKRMRFVESPRFVHHFRRDFRPSRRRIITPSLLRRAMRNWNATYRSIDGNETGADTIEIIINFAGIEPSSWRMKRGRALGTPLEYQLIRFETRFEARREEGGGERSCDPPFRRDD